MGQAHLASGKSVAMRLWRGEPATTDKPASRRDYETVGYVIDGRAELEIEGQLLLLEPNDSRPAPLYHHRALHRDRGDLATSAGAGPRSAQGAPGVSEPARRGAEGGRDRDRDTAGSVQRSATEARQGEIVLGRTGRWIWPASAVLALLLLLVLRR